MADLRVDRLSLFPVKSLGGVALKEMDVTRLGPEADRRWALVDDSGEVITQREYPILSQCRVGLNDSAILVEREGSTARLPLMMDGGETLSVGIWGDQVEAMSGPPEAGKWFSDLLGTSVRPVFMPDRSVRRVDPFFASDASFTTFTDGYPLLVASTASLDDLNRRMAQPIPIERFRPNVLVSGAEPFAEDYWGRVSIAGVVIRGVKPCKRCVIPTIDPEKGTKAKEPLRTLSTFRKWGTGVYFAENFVIETPGRIRVGDSAVVMTLRTEEEVARSRT